MSSRSREDTSSSTTSSYGELVDRPPAADPTTIIGGANTDLPPYRTMDDVRQLVAHSLAVRAIRKAEVIDGSQVGVVMTLSHTTDERFLRLIASSIKRNLLTQSFLFAVARPGAVPEESSPLLFCGSSDEHVERAGILISSKFAGRVSNSQHFIGRGIWVGETRGLGAAAFDHAALWDVVRKATRTPIHPLVPPPGSRSIDQILSDARARLERITPQQAYEELHDTTTVWPVVLVDIRPELQRRNAGGIDGSLIIERNVLEWRFDPRCTHRLAVANRYDLRVIIFCQEGYTSSLAAAALHDLGMLNTTDVIGGYMAWREAGLPSVVTPVVPSSTISASDEY